MRKIRRANSDRVDPVVPRRLASNQFLIGPVAARWVQSFGNGEFPSPDGIDVESTGSQSPLAVEPRRQPVDIADIGPCPPPIIPRRNTR